MDLQTILITIVTTATTPTMETGTTTLPTDNHGAGTIKQEEVLMHYVTSRERLRPYRYSALR